MAPAAAHAGAAVGAIVIEPGGDNLTITGRAVAVSDGHYDVDMNVRKSGKTGTTTTTQSGAFDLAAGESADVAKLGVSFAPGDDVVVELKVSEAGKVIWQTVSGTMPQ